MPDIKTALKEALQRKANQMHQTPPATTAAVKQIIAQWDDTEPTTTKEKEMPYEPPAAQKFTDIQAPSTTAPVTLTVFNYLRDKGGTTRAEVLRVMTKQGFRESTVSTLLSQLVVVGQVSNMGGVYKTIVPAYKPYDIKKARLANKATAKKIAKAAGIAALPPQATSKKQPVLTATPDTAMLDDDIDLILKRLSVFQAIALYKKLKVMLGEAV
jgi:hypothetical protein